MTDKNPTLKLVFTIGVEGMGEPATEVLEMELNADFGTEVFAKEMALKSQLAQLKLQIAFQDMMLKRFPVYALEKIESGEWDIPRGFLE